MGKPLKIAVNTRLLLENKLEGIGWFTYETMKYITQNHPEHQFYFIFDRPYSENFIFSKNVTPIVLFPQARHPFLYYLYFEFSLPKLLKKIGADYFISPDGYISLATNVKTLAVIHDINFEHRPQDLPYLARKYYQLFFPKFAKKASRICTVSEYSKQDISKTYAIPPSKIDVVYNGSNSIYSPISEDLKLQTKKKYTNGSPYFLFVGSLNPRKNIKNLLLAFDQFKKSQPTDLKLLVVGKVMWDDKSFKETYQQMQFKADVQFLGNVSSMELKNIFASALALTYIPFFEGFGIPILEAMNCEIPIITSNVTSIPEVAGDAALQVDPTNVEQIKNAMASIYTNTELQKNLIEKGRAKREAYSWEKTAVKLWESFEKMSQANT